MLNNRHITLLKNFVKKEYDKVQKDYKEFDTEMEIDRSLTYKEAKNLLIEKLRERNIAVADIVTKEVKEEKERFTKEALEKEEQNYKEQFEKRIEQIKSNSIQELSQYFQNYYQHIESFIENKTVNGFLTVGNGGVGKTFNLIYKLKERGINFKLVKGHFSALSFYRMLYENRENQHIIIDDVIKLIGDKDIISLILGATDYDNRQVEWTSNSPLVADLPRNFIFNSKIYILANEFDSEDKFLKALKDRCIHIELNFSKNQILEMLYILGKKKNYPIELVNYIKELNEKNVISNLSLRLLDKLYPYKKYNNWKELIKDILETDKLMNIVYELMKSTKTVKEQIEEFTERTGYHRRQYFYIKAKISAEMQSA